MERQLVNTKEMFERAQKEGYTIGAFNANNLEAVKAIVEACEEMQSPAIIQASTGAIKYAGMEYLMAMMEGALKSSTVPLAIHLDHGPDFEACKKVIDAGFKSVMIDGSHHPLEENIRITKEVVEYAHARGVTVEAELGRLAGVEDDVNVSAEDASYTIPEEAKRFVEETGCDSLAIAIGTSHGAFKFTTEPQLAFDRLEEIRAVLPENFPLVLHGASSVYPELVARCNENGGEIPPAMGVPNEMLSYAAKHGIAKVNTDTDLRFAMTGAIRETFVKDPAQIDPRKYCGPAKEAMKEIVKQKIEVFGSANKA
ncbi:MAG: class II fructose-1,6-bisphosphate aldolase [Alphaproteobacteria bacterium]|nr:class II fructose-1,6-bisphosphate aldolase [Alphaproteobacteria bacterium]